MSNYITYEERMEVENCLFNGKSFGEIAKELGKDRSTTAVLPLAFRLQMLHFAYKTCISFTNRAFDFTN